MNLPTTHWHILSVLLTFSTNNVAFAALSHSDEQKYLGECAVYDALGVHIIRIVYSNLYSAS